MAVYLCLLVLWVSSWDTNVATPFYWPKRSEDQTLVPVSPDPGMGNYMKSTVVDALYHSPAWSVHRYAQLAGADSPDAQVLTPEEATEKYGIEGHLSFFDPIDDFAAQIMQQRKLDEINRGTMLSLGANSLGRRAAGFGTSLIATVLDPINLAAMFVPVVGEARFAQMVKQFGGSMVKARLATGAIEGLVGSAMVEPLILLPATYEGSNYGLADSAINLGFGAILGGPLHVGFGAVGDRLVAGKLKERERVQQLVDRLNQVGDQMRIGEVVKPYDPWYHGTTSTLNFEEGKGLPHFAKDPTVAEFYTYDNGQVVEVEFAGKMATEKDITRLYPVDEDDIVEGIMLLHEDEGKTLREAGFDFVEFTDPGEGVVVRIPLTKKSIGKQKTRISKPIISPDTQHAAQSSAISDILQDRPVTSPGDVVRGADEVTVDEAKFDAKVARDEALKELGFDTEQKDTFKLYPDQSIADPKPNEPWFHGRDKDDNVPYNFNFSDPESGRPAVAWFARDPGYAAFYGDFIFVANIETKKVANQDQVLQAAKTAGIMEEAAKYYGVDVVSQVGEKAFFKANHVLPQYDHAKEEHFGYKVVDELRKQGFDSALIPDDGGKVALVVFSPDQIKTPGRRPKKTDTGILFADGKGMKRSLEQRIADLREAKVKNLVERKRREHMKRQAEIESARKQNPTKPEGLVKDDIDATVREVMAEIEEMEPGVVEQSDLESTDIPPEIREAVDNIKREKTVEDSIRAGVDCIIEGMS
jgi:hypothetical protein